MEGSAASTDAAVEGAGKSGDVAAAAPTIASVHTADVAAVAAVAAAVSASRGQKRKAQVVDGAGAGGVGVGVQRGAQSERAAKRWRKVKYVRQAISALYSGTTTHDVIPEVAQLGHPKCEPHEDTPCEVFKVAITGGPCGGKSSSLEHFTRRLTEEGFHVLAAPEVPTILVNGGCPFDASDPAKLMEFELSLLALQEQIENSFLRIARSLAKPVVVVFDRGLLDVAAYVPRKLWEEMLGHMGWEETQVLLRYDLVLHLVTAADGAPDFYTTANNSARRESAEEAIQMDRNVARAWMKHPNRAVVDNEAKDFDAKLKTATQHVLELVGLREVEHGDASSQNDLDSTRA